MTKTEIETLASNLIAQHLPGTSWKFGWNSRKRVFGLCSYKNKTISLSRYAAFTQSEEEIRGTLLHEIAHALAGWEAAHGPEFKSMAESIGVPKANLGSSRKVTDPTQIPRPSWVMHFKGEIMKIYYRRPSAKVFRTLPLAYWPGRKMETITNVELSTWAEFMELYPENRLTVKDF